MCAHKHTKTWTYTLKRTCAHTDTHTHTHTAVLQRSGDKSRYWNPSSLTAINYSVCVRVCVWQLVRQLCACVCRAAPIRFLSPLDYEFLGKRGDVPYQSSGWAIKHARAHTDVEPRYVAADRERRVCLRVCVLHCQRSWNEAQTVHQTTLTFPNSFTFFNLLWVKVQSNHEVQVGSHYSADIWATLQLHEHSLQLFCNLDTFTPSLFSTTWTLIGTLIISFSSL